MWKRSFPILILAVAGSLLAYALFLLFELRFSAGDVYPAYSSLRADPLGLKILHESLAEMPGCTVERNKRDLARAHLADGSVLIMAGLRRWELDYQPKAFFNELNHFVSRGGLLLAAFSPVDYVPRAAEEEETDALDDEAVEKDGQAGEKRRKEPVDGADDDADWASVTNLWGVNFSYAAFAPGQNDETADAEEEDWQSGPVASRDEADTNHFSSVATPELGEGPVITWKTTMHFTDLDPAWRVLYRRGGYPVLIERVIGKGRIVLASDTYFLSNEAMLRERHTELLAGLLAGRAHFIFEETHHMVRERAGIMSLVYKYRLQGGFLAALLLAALFIWQNAFPLVPPGDGARDDGREVVTGKQSAEGLLNMLERNLPPGELLKTCFHTWSRTARARPAKILKMKQLADDPAGASREGLVKNYRRMTEILAEREW